MKALQPLTELQATSSSENLHGSWVFIKKIHVHGLILVAMTTFVCFPPCSHGCFISSQPRLLDDTCKVQICQQPIWLDEAALQRSNFMLLNRYSPPLGISVADEMLFGVTVRFKIPTFEVVLVKMLAKYLETRR